MTRDQDIERVLDQWFAEGPTQMPSRFLISSSVSIPFSRNRSQRFFSPWSLAMRAIMGPWNGFP